MVKILNIVNGDIAIEIMKKAQISGEFLPWRDFLHEGPVLKTSSLYQLSKIRANFIYQKGFDTLDKLEKEFQQRDQVLEDYYQYDKIVLWFEHDLYDQLQLLQVLAWFSGHTIQTNQLTIISTHHYLGDCSKEEISKLLRYERYVTKEHLSVAKKAWLAFQSPTPEAWFNLLEGKTQILPFLEDAILRMLEEFPNTKNGLSRSEHQALLSISKGIDNPREIFNRCQKYEKDKFMGDVIFWKILDEFIENRIICSQKSGQLLTITELGQNLLNGKINYLHIQPINRWIGGTELTNDKVWCWNIKKRSINQYYYSRSLSSLLLFKS